MAPYTAAGIENHHESPTNAQYRLKGVVVHSGQASGGHYYSFIRDSGESGKWLKFDDCDVSEIELTDEELTSQCFGGDQGEIWDTRRNSYRRGRRWWNAYLLFYENMEEVSMNDLSQGLSDMSVNSSNSESFCVPAIDRRQLPPIMPSVGINMNSYTSKLSISLNLHEKCVSLNYRLLLRFTIFFVKFCQKIRLKTVLNPKIPRNCYAFL